MNDRNRDARALLLVVCCGLVAYATSLAGDFVYDDIHSVAANPAIRSLASVPEFFVDPGAFSTLQGHMYRPVLLSSFALDHAIGGLQPIVFKATNLLLHLLGSVLVWSVLRRLAVALPVATAAACWFAVHPLGSEAVNLVSGRSELLLVLGLLLGLWAHQSWLAGRRPMAALGVLAAVVACGSKETGVVLPVLLLVLEWLHRPQGIPLRSWAAGASLRLLPVVAVTVGYLLVRQALLGTATVDVAQLGGTGDLHSGHGRGVLVQWATMCTLLPRTLAQTVLPLGLSLEPYVAFHRSFADPQVLAGLLGLLLLTLVGLRPGRRRPAVVLGTCLAWGSSLPWILLPLNVPLSEHRLYGLLAGLAMVVAGALPAGAAGRAAAGRVRRLRPAFAGGAALLVLLAGMAATRSLDYRDERLLWRKVLAAQPTSFRAHWGLGLVLLRRGDVAGARQHLAYAHWVYPQHKSALVSYLEALLAEPEPERQQPFLGLVLADDLLARSPLDPYYRILKATALTQAGAASGKAEFFAEAEAVALSCLQIAVPKGLVFRVAAEARRQAGDLAGAIELLDESVRRGLDHYTVLVDRARLLLLAGRFSEAEADLQSAMAQAPLDPQVRALFDSLRAARPR